MAAKAIGKNSDALSKALDGHEKADSGRMGFFGDNRQWHKPDGKWPTFKRDFENWQNNHRSGMPHESNPLPSLPARDSVMGGPTKERAEIQKAHAALSQSIQLRDTLDLQAKKRQEKRNADEATRRNKQMAAAALDAQIKESQKAEERATASAARKLGISVEQYRKKKPVVDEIIRYKHEIESFSAIVDASGHDHYTETEAEAAKAEAARIQEDDLMNNSLSQLQTIRQRLLELVAAHNRAVDAHEGQQTAMENIMSGKINGGTRRRRSKSKRRRHTTKKGKKNKRKTRRGKRHQKKRTKRRR